MHIAKNASGVAPPSRQAPYFSLTAEGRVESLGHSVSASVLVP
jgi:hypothetical protein